ncbi:MAG: ammonium transporter [Lentisphaerae bacterium]|jgi:ammonium transporter, Amt family|nr:ammonium transporter [Lentisphaerota bacterium]MBT4821616.1 ammonium transporter [Lentisphaerota bacterium]MBT5611434.1 ammonium transporter [Lentisphaerota bacterium]MBT7059663.1 ammonium transporter [Lentisphaerota bacterium]MBT7846891.1 ammonium transporter [Lentisphaerota bacterium]
MTTRWLRILGVSAVALTAAATGFAEEAAVEPATQVQTNLNIVWTCVAAFLVFFMQAGFAMVEAGFTRAKNACNIMMKNLMDFSVGSIMWFLVGFGLMFGGGASGLCGGSHFAASDFSASELNWTFWLFQCVFAGTAATIVSGAMAGRTKFTGYLCYSAIICAFIYPISGHWAWGSLFGIGEGWLEKKSFIDFAGSTVVHSCGAWLALAGAIVLGPRIGKRNPDGSVKAIPGHNIPIAALGVFILWFGWFGFNPGSTTTGDSSIGFIAMTTNLAAAAGAIGAMIVSWFRYKKPDVSMSLNGVLAGLVAITAGCANVTPVHAIIIGFLAGIIVVLSVEFIDKVLKVDDPVGAVSVHGVCGAFGTIMAGVFNTPNTPGYVEGGSVGTQLLGVGAIFAWAFGLGMILFTLIKVTVGLRASKEEELRGLDISEHGNEAYCGFQIFTNQ